MNLNSLKLFNTFAAELSFSKTASLLYVSQPAVSMQIKKLEDELGLKLFERIGNHLHLTDNGKLLCEYTKKIFTLVDEIDIALSTQNTNIKGQVEIGASNTPGTYILPEILAEYNRKYPNITINLHIGNTFEVEKMVSENRVDFAVSGGESLSSEVIQTEWLVEDEMIFVTSPMNRLAGREDVDKNELLSERYIAHEKNSRLYELIERILREINLPVDGITCLGQIDAIKRAVSLEMGISVLPALTVKAELEAGSLKQFNIKDKKWYYSYSLIYNIKRHQTPASRNFMKLIKDKMNGNALTNI